MPEKRRIIPIGAPALVGNEKKYVMECMESTWISSRGPYLERFEEAFADFCGAPHAVSCSSGTAALHMALLVLGVGLGDEVIVPTLTYVSCANAVAYCGARPVFVDSDPETWNLDPSLIASKITARTKGIIAVHLYGHPADMDPILAVARKHGLFVLEDAAQAHGALYRGRRAGTLADAAVFSFFASKILTTGEGGMVVTANAELARRVRELKGQGMSPDRRYWHSVIGYNYGMTNVAAAIGLAQVEKAAWHVERHREVSSWYRQDLQHRAQVVFQGCKEWAEPAYWMVSVMLTDEDVDRDRVIATLWQQGIETRPVFYPLHTLPPYAPYREPGPESLAVAERIAGRGISLPTWAGLAREDVRFVCDELLKALEASEARFAQADATA